MCRSLRYPSVSRRTKACLARNLERFCVGSVAPPVVGVRGSGGGGRRHTRGWESSRVFVWTPDTESLSATASFSLARRRVVWRWLSRASRMASATEIASAHTSPERGDIRCDAELQRGEARTSFAADTATRCAPEKPVFAANWLLRARSLPAVVFTGMARRDGSGYGSVVFSRLLAASGREGGRTSTTQGVVN